MSEFWARTLVYLGLREEPDDQVEWDVLAAAEGDAVAVGTPADRQVAARPVKRPPDAPARPTNVRSLREVDQPVQAPGQASASAAARPARLAVVQLRAFDDVEAVGTNHLARRAVLLDVGACDHPTARRVVDFVSGMTYATGGSLRRITTRGYLLLPDGVALDAEERERLAQAGYPLDGRDQGGRG